MVKEKPNSIRIYDEEGFRRRAACICVRSDAETEVSTQLPILVSLTLPKLFWQGPCPQPGQCRRMFTSVAKKRPPRERANSDLKPAPTSSTTIRRPNPSLLALSAHTKPPWRR
jgi:hypothetical protein